MPVTKPFIALVLNFTARFFDFDLLGLRGDLRSSYLWLVAALAPIGILMPWFMVFEWEFIVLDKGTAALRLASMVEKSLYLGLSVIVPGALTLLSWPALLVDRRDALILGALPISSSTVMRAKILAIGLYGGFLSVGMHAAGSVSFALLLSSHSPFSFLVRGVVAHFVAASMASCFALAAITSLQGGALALVGPRVFRRVSPILQVGITAAILLLLLTLPSMSGQVVDAVSASSPAHRWVFFLPPVWFLGVYEWLLGTDDELLRGLAARAGLALAGVAIATVLLVPLAGRRLFEDAVAGSVGHRPRSRRPRPLDRLARIISRVPQRKAGAQMLLATCGRVSSHRFAVALATGVFAAFAVPAVFSGLVHQPLAVVPPVSVLAIPLVGISVALIAMRVAAGLSTDLRSGWMCAATVGQTPHGTVALRRIMWLLGILPMAVVFPAITWMLWDATTAVAQVVVAAGLGFIVTEGLTRGFSGIPCTRPWQPLNANLRAFWPAYLGLVLFITQALPRLMLLLGGSPSFVAVAVPVFGACAFLLRSRQLPAPEENDE